MIMAEKADERFLFLNKFLSLFQNIKFVNNKSFFFNNNYIPK